jgi:hypothetical protein
MLSQWVNVIHGWRHSMANDADYSAYSVLYSAKTACVKFLFIEFNLPGGDAIRSFA